MLGSWNWIDWVLVVYVLFSAARGLRVGFIRSVLALAGMVLGVGIAYIYSRSLTGWVETRYGLVDRVGSSLEGIETLPVPLPVPAAAASEIAAVLVHGLVFAVTVLLVAWGAAVVAYFLSGGIRYAGLGPADNFLGLGFGVIRALVTAAIVFGLLVSFSHISHLAWGIDSLSASQFGPALLRFFYSINPWMPGA